MQLDDSMLTPYYRHMNKQQEFLTKLLALMEEYNVEGFGPDTEYVGGDIPCGMRASVTIDGKDVILNHYDDYFAQQELKMVIDNM